MHGSGTGPLSMHVVHMLISAEICIDVLGDPISFPGRHQWALFTLFSSIGAPLDL